VEAPAPNRAGHVLPQHEHDAIDASPFSGSDVPSWSQSSMRCLLVSDCTVQGTTDLLPRLGPDGVRSTLL
jgi:hypothetical protein